MQVLVVGGAGYVGSHCTRLLFESGYDVTVLDDLSTGYAEAVFGKLVVGDIRNRELLDSMFRNNKFEVVLCFAAKLIVPESFLQPIEYFDVNVGGMLVLLDTMRKYGCNKLVFSSTCAIYGMAKNPRVNEQEIIAPISPYGESKAMVERILDHAAPFVQSVRFRYFNAAGASGDSYIGGARYPKTHLIGSAFSSILSGTPIKVFGRDYPTPDGTGIRDYIHVEDLATAHLKAVIRLESGMGGGVWNLGVGKGYSVVEVLSGIENVTGKKFEVSYEPRREGDPPALYADNTKLREDYGWVPSTPLSKILEDAWRWELRPRFGNKKG